MAWPDWALRITASVNSMYRAPSSKLVHVTLSLPRIALINSSSTRHLLHPQSSLLHLAVTTGGDTVWMEEVTEDAYTKDFN